MKQSDLETLLICCEIPILQAVDRFDTPYSVWLKGLLKCNLRMVGIITLANKSVRGL